MTAIYTIGHSNHALESFFALLRQHGISTLVDVRSRPYSKWSPHFKKEPLSGALRNAGLDYVFSGRELGGMPDGDEFYDAGGRIDYARRAQSSEFVESIERLAAFVAARATALMCAEETPTHCHRRRLITPALEERGVEVVHIRGDGRLEPEAALRAPSPQLRLFE